MDIYIYIYIYPYISIYIYGIMHSSLYLHMYTYIYILNKYCKAVLVYIWWGYMSCLSLRKVEVSFPFCMRRWNLHGEDAPNSDAPNSFMRGSIFMLTHEMQHINRQLYICIYTYIYICIYREIHRYIHLYTYVNVYI